MQSALNELPLRSVRSQQASTPLCALSVRPVSLSLRPRTLTIRLELDHCDCVTISISK